MDYGKIIEKSWKIVWRFRFLWILGLLAGGGGTCGVQFPSAPSTNFQTGAGEFLGSPYGVSNAFNSFQLWVNQNLGLIFLGIAIIFVVGLILWIISLIFEGSLTSATIDLAQGRATGFGLAWRDGLHYFWRFFGFFWLSALIWIVILAIFVVPPILIFIAAGQGAGVCFGILWILIGAIVLLVVGIAWSIVAPFTWRAMIAEDKGPISGLGFAYELFRHNISKTLIAWLISVLLGIGAAIATLIIIGIVGAILAALGFVTYAGVGFTPALFVYGAIAVLIFWIVALIVGGFVNAFFNQYWTFVYLFLTGRVDNLLEVVRPPQPPAPTELPEQGGPQIPPEENAS